MNKYKPETLKDVDVELKTGKIEPTHYNTTENIHLSNIKRPRQKIYKTKIISGSSRASSAST